MSSSSAAALRFAELLVRADDPASLFDALGQGLGPMFPHLSINASFDFDRRGHPHTVWSTAPQPPRTKEWAARFTAGNPGLPWLRRHPGTPVLCMDEVIPFEEQASHPFVQEFVRPQGWVHVMSLFVWQQGHIVGYVAINRAERHGAFTRAERDLARAVHPLLAAAHARIAAARREDDLRRAHETVLRSLPLPILVWTPRDGRVLFYNRAAIEAIAHWRGEERSKRPRTLTARWLPDDIVATSQGLAKEGAEVRCPRAGLRATLSRVVRPPGTHREHFAKDVVLVVLHDDSTPDDPSAAWLRVASALTTAERDVAKLAARGLSNADIGRVLGKSPLTVKKQLESVFDKAGVDGRTGLAALFAGLAPPDPTR